MNVLLLAGLYHRGELLREAKLRPFTGQVEQQMTEVLSSSETTPVKVSHLINSFVVSLVNDTLVLDMTRQLAGELLPADRQILILKLAQMLEGDHVWLHPDCESCGETFDLGYQRSQLPVSSVEPQKLVESLERGVLVNFGDHALRFRQPTGNDQIEIARFNNDDAVQTLLSRLLVDASPSALDFCRQLQPEQFDRVADALDAVTPQVADQMQTQCPNCQHEQTVLLDPYYMQGLGSEQLVREVHALAMNYHWSEEAILALPRQRRRRYIQLINEAGGYLE